MYYLYRFIETHVPRPEAKLYVYIVYKNDHELKINTLSCIVHVQEKSLWNKKALNYVMWQWEHRNFRCKCVDYKTHSLCATYRPSIYDIQDYSLCSDITDIKSYTEFEASAYLW